MNEEAGPYDGACDITASANEEAAFEDKFVDVLMLEDPQNMMQALDRCVNSRRTLRETKSRLILNNDVD